ncbi:hypothetical protein JCM10450v2_002780 [Rhodotorula kratochvilovae]
MLDAALHARLSPTAGGNAPLLVLSDSLLQPSLPLLRSFVAAALSPSQSGRVVLLATAHSPVRLLPPPGTYDPAHVRVVDASLAAPYASTSSAASYACAKHTQVDLSSPEGAAALLAAAKAAIAASGAGEGPVLVVLDSANALADELHGGVGDAARVVKGCLESLKGRKGARLLLTHHADLPSPPAPSPSSLQPALLPTLLSPSLSPSTLHLHLRPAAHLALLTREYALPPTAPGSEPDARAHGLLARLAERAVGDPFVRPLGAEDEDERVPLGGGGGGAGACVVEWTARGVEPSPSGSGTGAGTGSAGADARAKERERAARGEVRRGVRWGMCGARVAADGQASETELWEVVDPAEMRVRTGGEQSPLPSPLPSSSTSTSHPPPAPAPTALPFSLHPTTASQALARASVPNPFARNDLPIYGEEGYVPPILPGQGGGIEYTPDRGDDWDEEDPDGDLEL